jgi:Mn2+/Fe2+ NRAMP family transporter
MRKYLEVALGIFTSIGGFLEVGAIVTTAQAGAQFGYRLGWVLVLGTVCVIFLVEMSGRLSAVSRHTLQDAMRERFGAGFFLVTTIPGLVVDWLVLGAEIGGVAIALQLVTGIGYQWWAFPVAIAGWFFLWRGNLGLVENGVALLGLVALAFVVAAVKLHPPLHEMAAGLLPSIPPAERTSYWFLAVSILGALISPYLFFFYSSGAVEDQWDENHIGSNRFTAIVGMSFGAVLAFGVLVAAAVVFHPRGIQVARYEQAALMLIEPLGRLGLYLFAAALAITCFGALLEVALGRAYVFAQGFGWNYTLNSLPTDSARFSLVYTAMIGTSAALIALGIDPLALTVFSMALTAVTLPLVTVPFIVLMNDPAYLGEYRNGWIGNAAVVGISLLASLIALVAIPLQLMGG